MDHDLVFALKLQEEYDDEYKRSQKKSFMDIPVAALPKTSIIDPMLEFTDPTPDVHRMFVGFDRHFFWSSLGAVEVMWSPRMTSCAGICRYRSRNGACTVHLSLPLLKLRPRKDLVETLLHEMIHAYLFVTKNNKDREGHGPEFQAHMQRINKSAGTNITVYHNFHAEVNVYKTHWWRCSGPCQHWKPFYGLVKRATNRAPGPNDFWFADHQHKCGGQFVKIKEPENYKSKKGSKSRMDEKAKPASRPVKTLHDFYKKTNTNPVKSPGAGSSIRGPTKMSNGVLTVTSVVNKESEGSQRILPRQPQSAVVPFSGQGFALGKTAAPITNKPWLKRLNTNLPDSSNSKGISGHSVSAEHSGSRKNADGFSAAAAAKNAKRIKLGDLDNKASQRDEELPCSVACPVCNKTVFVAEVNEHLDTCLSGCTANENSLCDQCVVCENKLDKSSPVPTLCSVCEVGVSCSELDSEASWQEDRAICCPMCARAMNSGDLERHLEECIADVDSDNSVYFTNDWEEEDEEEDLKLKKNISKAESKCDSDDDKDVIFIGSSSK